MQLLRKLIRYVGFKLISLSNKLVGTPVYRADSKSGFASGATLVHELLRDNAGADGFKFTKIYIWNRGTEDRFEPMYEEALQAAQKHGVSVVHSKNAVPWNYVRGRRLNMSAEFMKWDDSVLPGNHLVLNHPVNISSIGAITRTALAFGIHDIIIIDENTPDTFDPSLLRSSMGNRLKVRMEAFFCFEEYLSRFPDNIIYVLTDDERAKPLEMIRIQMNYSIVIGYKEVNVPKTYDGMYERISIGNSPDVAALTPEISAGIALSAITKELQQNPIRADLCL